jgi:cytochrome c peroxidase
MSKPIVVSTLLVLSGLLSAPLVLSADAKSVAKTEARPELLTKGATDKERLGQRIFFDKGLSEPRGQSCASCHDPATAFSDPIAHSPTSRGVNKTLFGPRNTPSAMYASFSPTFRAGDENGGYLGGQFRDGRANTLEDQAKGPFLNPVEMANPSAQAVVDKLRLAPYAALFESVYGKGVFDDTSKAYDSLVDALATFERTKVFAPFSSKYDAWQQGKASLTDAELRGLAAFNAEDKGNCASCHMTVSSRKDGRKSVFTDFGYDNLGVPRNPANRFYTLPAQYNPDGWNYIDIGLGNVVLRDFVRGQFKAPTLRNIAVTGPYTHNGYFKTLRGVVDFYNTRDVKPVCPDPLTSEAKALKMGCWPVAEVPETVNRASMGNLGLTEQEVDDIVAFMGTLTDGWQAPAAAKKR